MRFVLLFFALLVAAPALAKPLNVVASFSILADLTQQIGGDNVRVLSLVERGGDAHVFEPTPFDARKIADADVVVINGLGFEGWMTRLLNAANYKGVVVTASNGISETLQLEKETDPHAWQDLKNGQLYVRNIAAALMKADPDHKEYYVQRAAALEKELGMLDAWVKTSIARVPQAKRVVITAHDAFGYFSRAYGVNFLAPLGLNTEDEPSAKELKALITQIKTGNVKALFLEQATNPNVLQQLVAEAGAVIGGTLYADTLSPEKGEAASYQSMFTHNVKTLVQGMEGSVKVP